jgi:prepilin-type N-terminal cleavage/methylation domain-containing protein
MPKLLKGFTLIEVLVVIGVLVIFVTMLPRSVQYVFQQGKDANRKNDIKQYQIALENYASQNESLYPLAPTTISAASTLCSTLSTYLTKCLEDQYITKDPTYTYLYQSSANGTSYVLWAKQDKGDKYWVVCSNKKIGAITTTGFAVSGGNCPLL